MMPNYASDVEAWMLYAFAIVAMVMLTLFGTDIVTTGPVAWVMVVALCISYLGAQVALYNEEQRRRFRRNIWMNNLERWLFIAVFFAAMCITVAFTFLVCLTTRILRAEK